MSAVNTCLPLNCTFLSSSSLSSSLEFFRAFSLSLLLGRNVTPRLTLTRTLSTRPLTHTEFAMAVSDSRKLLRSSNSSKCAEIVIIRHGETEWNANGKIQGHLDIELNDAGRKQAAGVAERLLKEPKISFIYSSDLKRALETAEIIAASCGVEVIKDSGLRERHLGDLQGLPLRDAAKAFPEAYEAFLSPRKDLEIPGGGESRDQLYRRGTSTLRRIGRKHIGQRIVVVTHGGFIRTLHRWACPNKKSVGKVLNTAVSVFRYSDDDKWTLDVWGDVSHLDLIGFLQSGFGGDRTSG